MKLPLSSSHLLLLHSRWVETVMVVVLGFFIQYPLLPRCSSASHCPYNPSQLVRIITIPFQVDLLCRHKHTNTRSVCLFYLCKMCSTCQPNTNTPDIFHLIETAQVIPVRISGPHPLYFRLYSTNQQIFPKRRDEAQMFTTFVSNWSEMLDKKVKKKSRRWKRWILMRNMQWMELQQQFVANGRRSSVVSYTHIERC